MGKPEIIGYKTEFVGPPGVTLGADDWDKVHLFHTRPIYRERPFHAKWTPEGHVLLCRHCEMTSPEIKHSGKLHDIALAHRDTWHD